MVKKFLVSSVLGGMLAANAAWACPRGQDDVCVLPRPWGGCAQSACIPVIKVENPLDQLSDALDGKAMALASDAKGSGAAADEAGCVVIVTAGLTAWAATLTGPAAAAIGGAAGAAAASMACRHAFNP